MNSRFFQNACLVTAAAALAGFLSTPAGALEDAPRVRRFEVQIALPEGKNKFYRGGLDSASPARGLVVTVTLTNPTADLPVNLRRPMLAVWGGIEFNVFLLGAPTGEVRTRRTPERTRIKRSPLLQPVGTRPEAPEMTLKPGESRRFEVPVGPWFAFKQAGKYEMSCRIGPERSNTVEFEVLPLRVVSMPVRHLISRIDDFERGGPDFPYMFYVVHGGGRFDEIVYIVRRPSVRTADGEKLPSGSYEYHRLGDIAPGTLPEMITSTTRVGVVGLLVPDKRSDSLSRIYLLDLGRRPMVVTGRQVVHPPGVPPTLGPQDLERIGGKPMVAEEEAEEEEEDEEEFEEDEEEFDEEEEEEEEDWG